MIVFYDLQTIDNESLVVYRLEGIAGQWPNPRTVLNSFEMDLNLHSLHIESLHSIIWVVLIIELIIFITFFQAILVVLGTKKVPEHF